MIRYNLICDTGHAFDGWFATSGDFERQSAGGLLGCPVCGSVSVGKALMAPGVVTSEQRAKAAPAAAEAPLPLATLPPEARLHLERLRELKAKMLEGSENVGGRFAEEARRIHFGEAPARAVHGEASAEEARALMEDGVDFLPLPVLPDERN